MRDQDDRSGAAKGNSTEKPTVRDGLTPETALIITSDPDDSFESLVKRAIAEPGVRYVETQGTVMEILVQNKILLVIRVPQSASRSQHFHSMATIAKDCQMRLGYDLPVIEQF